LPTPYLPLQTFEETHVKLEQQPEQQSPSVEQPLPFWVQLACAFAVGTRINVITGTNAVAMPNLRTNSRRDTPETGTDAFPINK
jgi:hypothetical protein